MYYSARFTIYGEEISDLSGFGSSYIFTILKEKFKRQKICAPSAGSWTKEGSCGKGLSRVKNRNSCRLREVVTGDETWLYFYIEPDNKLNNKDVGR